jgi:hypothetical protein
MDSIGDALSTGLLALPPVLMALAMLAIILWQTTKLVELIHSAARECFGDGGIPVRVIVVREDEVDEDPE